MEAVIIKRARGGEAERDLFNGYEVIANPLGGTGAADRERRVLGRVDGKPGTGCDYGSHSIRLAVREGDKPYKGGRTLFILMQHGGGKVIYRMKQMYDGGETERALLALPEAALYGILYTICSMVDDADSLAKRETAHAWGMAYSEKRIRIRRFMGRRTVEIESKDEKAMRLAS